MPESADEVYARVVAAAEAGRLPMPDFPSWATFPWAVQDGEIVPAMPDAPADEEPRGGEGDRPCPACGDVDGVIWENDDWRVKHLGQTGLPLVLLLETQEHIDFNELSDDLAGEFGRISVRLARIIEGLPNIARTHVYRVGDGGSHCHVWYFARTERLLSTRGSFLVDWDDILPPGPADVWQEDLSYVARHLATHGGHALV